MTFRRPFRRTRAVGRFIGSQSKAQILGACLVIVLIGFVLRVVATVGPTWTRVIAIVVLLFVVIPMAWIIWKRGFRGKSE